MRRLLFVLAFLLSYGLWIGLWVIWLPGCAGPAAYNGPTELLPFMRVNERRVLGGADPLHPRWDSERTGEIVNPSEARMRVVVRCAKTSIDVVLPARSSQLFSLQQGEGECSVYMATRRPTAP